MAEEKDQIDCLRVWWLRPFRILKEKPKVRRQCVIPFVDRNLQKERILCTGSVIYFAVLHAI